MDIGELTYESFNFPATSDAFDHWFASEQARAKPCPRCGATVVPAAGERHIAWHHGIGG